LTGNGGFSIRQRNRTVVLQMCFAPRAGLSAVISEGGQWPQKGFLPSRPDLVLGMPLRRRRRHSYQPRAIGLGSSPQARFPALKARLILPPRQEQPPQRYEAGRWPALGKRGHEPRAIALGWYETGRWPGSNGVSPQTRIGQQGGGYMKRYLLSIYKRRLNPVLSRLLKEFVLHPGAIHDLPLEALSGPPNPKPVRGCNRLK
jgi:hypothetical protein